MECQLLTLSSSVSETLSTRYNEIFSQGIFPDHMKHAMVTPVHKGGSKLDMTNYRPISVLPICSKILEKLMLTRLLDFLDRNNIIYKHQFGFQKNKSTTRVCFWTLQKHLILLTTKYCYQNSRIMV